MGYGAQTGLGNSKTTTTTTMTVLLFEITSKNEHKGLRWWQSTWRGNQEPMPTALAIETMGTLQCMKKECSRLRGSIQSTHTFKAKQRARNKRNLEPLVSGDKGETLA